MVVDKLNISNNIIRYKQYLICNKDIELIRFSISEESLSFYKDIIIINKEFSNMFSSISKLNAWVNNRVIQTNRIHIEEFMKSIELNSDTKFNLLKVNHGCSLNDTLWIKELNEKNFKGEDLTWKDVSLYSGFKESLGMVSFFGNTKSLGGNIKTPETTSQGALGKAWRIIDGEVILYKKGMSGASNWGREPYSEVIASKILDLAGVAHIHYDLSKWGNVLCSTCKLYTSEKYGYLTMANYLSYNYSNNSNDWDYNYVLDVMENLNLVEKFKTMLFIDSIILNFDRHFSNFGFLVDNDTGDILDLMPLFDHGYSLGCYLDIGDDISRDYKRPGTFGNIQLINQGKALSKERFSKTIIKNILTQIDEIDYLLNIGIPLDRIELAKEIVKSMCL
ncbi:MAG: hypothetical protein ACRC41_18455, partial [Sarcina sp.]